MAHGLDRLEAAQGMYQAGIGSLSGRPLNPIPPSNTQRIEGALGEVAQRPNYDWNSAFDRLEQANKAQGEYNKFQVRANEPLARRAESGIFNLMREKQNKWPWSLNISRRDQPRGQYKDVGRWRVEPSNVYNIPPEIWANRGNEYQVAGDPGEKYPLSSIGNRYGSNYEELETIPLDLQFDEFGVPIGSDDYGYFDDDYFAARGGLMRLV